MAVACGVGTRLKVAIATPRLPGSHPPPSEEERPLACMYMAAGAIGGDYGNAGKYSWIFPGRMRDWHRVSRHVARPGVRRL